MALAPTILGAALGGGVVPIFFGVRRLSDRTLEETVRRKGFWLLNAGLVLAAVSMYLMVQVKAG